MILLETNAMNTAEIVETSNGQTIRLPNEFRFETTLVSIRREGDAVILDPMRSPNWPDRFFEDIRIDDPGFARPAQGLTPAAPSLE
jgi:virulence-associated protein VagC